MRHGTFNQANIIFKKILPPWISRWNMWCQKTLAQSWAFGKFIFICLVWIQCHSRGLRSWSDMCYWFRWRRRKFLIIWIISIWNVYLLIEKLNFPFPLLIWCLLKMSKYQSFRFWVRKWRFWVRKCSFTRRLRKIKWLFSYFERCHPKNSILRIQFCIYWAV